PGDSYRWWVRAWTDGGASSGWAAAPTFSVKLLDTPITTAPVGSLPNATPTFTWNTVTGADYYEIWISDASASQPVPLNVSFISGASFTPAQPMVPGHQYRWWIKAHSINGDVSAWSATTTFTIAFLATPALTGPTGPITNTTPTFTWNSVTGAD